MNIEGNIIRTIPMKYLSKLAEVSYLRYTPGPLKSLEVKLMANKTSKGAKGVEAANSRDDLAGHIEAFLKAGGKVQQIPSGVSGQTSTSGPRQIVLSHKSS